MEWDFDCKDLIYLWNLHLRLFSSEDWFLVKRCPFHLRRRNFSIAMNVPSPICFLCLHFFGTFTGMLVTRAVSIDTFTNSLLTEDLLAWLLYSVFTLGQFTRLVENHPLKYWTCTDRLAFVMKVTSGKSFHLLSSLIDLNYLYFKKYYVYFERKYLLCIPWY